MNWDSFEFDCNICIREVIDLIESLLRHLNLIDVKCYRQSLSREVCDVPVVDVVGVVVAKIRVCVVYVLATGKVIV